jgi:DNA-binding NtrC family response regulator
MSSPPSAHEVEARSKVPPTILIVDDEPSVANSLSLILQHHGYNCIVARTGEEAVELARSTPPHALVCDVIMHGINGIEAALQFELFARNAASLSCQEMPTRLSSSKMRGRRAISSKCWQSRSHRQT